MEIHFGTVTIVVYYCACALKVSRGLLIYMYFTCLTHVHMLYAGCIDIFLFVHCVYFSSCKFLLGICVN